METHVSHIFLIIKISQRQNHG